MVAKANEFARSQGWHQFKAMQYYYSLSGRDAEDALIPYAETENLVFVPWSPPAGGFLTGKLLVKKKNPEKMLGGTSSIFRLSTKRKRMILWMYSKK